jgi:hypothetical protein
MFYFAMVFCAVTNVAFSTWGIFICGKPGNLFQNFIFHGCQDKPTFKANLYLNPATDMLVSMLFGIPLVALFWESTISSKQKTSIALFLGMALM